MSHIDRTLEKGELVEVSVADDCWVPAEVISDMETRVSVKLLRPVVWVERHTIVEVRWLGLLKSKITKTITSKYVDKITVSCLLIRLK
ncbi:MAG: hypothetical protein A2747_01260 [Candidatus Yonathbacteria bacterium RIFCSPHIGHO2_01_FULL_44_41]|uniref:Uncharacterized protein n=1 Tax=Candidatus Yonathbacteria bacterium RIFCSPHIGHO2_02_FULL_44_14 TaxID=1802724 RepID=A0A1G2S799_9BACT|nr:MAG: hypothetical protein A2747_01260 [Candidatus Yonathbacteria bacterium RIFCSPHIGHO2_01_FULL_44_41]OHA80936.1 MAG: hypothetical protein A3D51_02840 [Candidatus Yonathbacteria bacterium RIFCSPHIGHO2_02_FULL_44_14]OHA82369.1 MAG: hypothetical protein A3B06_00480 [Candidatus Yonathbacteria bacterium RIFCSPLOWO2_01_FULL_43_20]